MSRGELAAQVAKSLLAARVHDVDASSYAFGAYRNGAEVREAIEKAAVNAVSPTGTVLADPASYDFAEYIRPLTILGRVAGLRRAPSRVRCSVVATGGAAAYWVGNGVAINLSAAAIAGELFDTLKVGALSVQTKETAKSTLPAAEQMISRDLTAAMVEAMDLAFIDPENAGTSDVKPAAVTYDAPTVTSTGDDLDSIDADLDGLIQALSDAGSNLQFATFVMQTKTALYLSRLRGSGGALAHPGMTAKGGVLLGLPCVASSTYPEATASPPERTISLIDPAQILYIDDGAGSFLVSDKVTLHMDDNSSMKSTATATATATVSMFQTESIAIRAVRHVNWKVLRAGAAAQVLTRVTY